MFKDESQSTCCNLKNYQSLWWKFKRQKVWGKKLKMQLVMAIKSANPTFKQLNLNRSSPLISSKVNKVV